MTEVKVDKGREFSVEVLKNQIGFWNIGAISIHGQYGGFNTNASLESLWKNKDEICPACAPLGTFLCDLVHTIEELGKEHRKISYRLVEGEGVEC
jgi:hypothetical protein